MPVPFHDIIPVEVGAVVPEGIFLTDGIRLSVQCFLKYICAASASSGIYGSQGAEVEQGTTGGGSWERIREGLQGSDILVSNRIRSVKLYVTATRFAGTLMY